MSLVSHFINLMYFPRLSKNIELSVICGEVKKDKDKVFLKHPSAKLNLDITTRI